MNINAKIDKMKKVVVFLVLLIIASAIISVNGQTSSISFGDKNSKEIKESVKLFQGQIREYNKNITKLTKERHLFDVRFTRDSTSVGKMRYLREMKRCDSILAVYREKIGNNEEQIENLLIAAASKDKINRTDLKVRRSGRNINQLADASLKVAYANQMMSGNDLPKPLKGVIKNEYYRGTTVLITGPAGYYEEFRLESGDQREFSLPCPGLYTAVSSADGEKVPRKVEKPVGPLYKYNYKGKNYDFSAIICKK
jgi:hypothetical protein